jgi:hypothetical protein
MKKGSKTSVAHYIEQQIAISGISQKEMAGAMGYENPNVITMFKQGRTKLPITKVGPCAKALKVDPVHLLRLVLSEYMPDTYSAIEELIGKTLISDSDQKLLKLVHEATGSYDLTLNSAEHRAKLTKVIREIVSEENPTTIRAKK